MNRDLGSKSDRLSPGMATMVVVVSVLLVLVIAELVISHRTSMGIPPKKLSFQTIHGFGHCYRSMDSALPIDLLDEKQAAALEATLVGHVSDMARDGATRCVAYDVRARRRGTHPERSRQVAIVGDSFAFGEGLPDDRTLGAFMADRFPKIGFPSFAFSGAGVKQVEGQVERALDDPRKPTDIVYFYNINDVGMTPEMSKRFSYVMDFENFRWADTKAPGEEGFWESRSALVRVVEGAWLMSRLTELTTRNYLDMYLAPVNQPALDATLDSIAKMAARAAERRVGFHFVLYPLLYKDIWGRYPFAPIHELLMETCKKWRADCVDGSLAFRDQWRMGQLVVDRSDFHPNARANRRMAEYLATLRNS